MTVLMTELLQQSEFLGRWPHEEVRGEFGCFHNCRQMARIGDAKWPPDYGGPGAGVLNRQALSSGAFWE